MAKNIRTTVSTKNLVITIWNKALMGQVLFLEQFLLLTHGGDIIYLSEWDSCQKLVEQDLLPK